MLLDVFQQVFSLSLLSNRASDLTGTQTSLQKALQKEVISALPGIGTGWQLVWGPVVWKKQPDEATTGPENSWYIAYNQGLRFDDGSVRPAYVIAIAGTPSKSSYAWFKEDFGVNSVSNFNTWVAGGIQNPPAAVRAKNISPGEPYIATGTVNAVHLLLATKAPEGATSPGTTLLEFIANLDQSSSPRIISTGHSLGGALSPSLALALVSARVIPANNTLTYPTAGSSPGNAGFTDLFIRTFPARKPVGAKTYQGWNLNLVNTLDVVPQAWCSLKRISREQNLGNIPPIYGLPVLPLVNGATFVFTAHSRSSGVWYKPLPSQYFTGVHPSATPRTMAEFLQIFGQQHVMAYINETAVKPPTFHVPLGVGLGEKSEHERRFNYPVIAEFEWAHEHPEAAQKIIREVEASPEAQQLSSEIQNGEA